MKCTNTSIIHRQLGTVTFGTSWYSAKWSCWRIKKKLSVWLSYELMHFGTVVSDYSICIITSDTTLQICNQRNLMCSFFCYIRFLGVIHFLGPLLLKHISEIIELRNKISLLVSNIEISIENFRKSSDRQRGYLL